MKEIALLADFHRIRLVRKTVSAETYVASSNEPTSHQVVIKALKQLATAQLAAVADACSRYHGLSHPGIASIATASVDKRGNVYYVREWYNRFDRSNFTENTLRSLVDTIDFLGKAGICHGSVRPSNIFARADHPEKVILADPRLLRVISVKAEVQVPFTAPEVLRGAHPNFESDLYSLGVTLWWFLTGHVFQDRDRDELVKKYLEVRPTKLVNSQETDFRFLDLVSILLDKDPSKRLGAHNQLIQRFDASDNGALGRIAPFIGQSRTIAAAMDFSLEASTGLRVFLVRGVKGIGKTRFIGQIGYRLRFWGHKTIYVTGSNKTKTLPDVIQHLLQSCSDIATHKLASTFLVHLRDCADCVVGKAPKGSSCEKALNDAITSVMDCWLDDRIAFIIDDSHLLDEYSLVFIKYTILRAPRAQMRFIISLDHTKTIHPLLAQSLSYVETDRSLTIDLDPLGTLDCTVLATLLGVEDVPTVVRETGGNPLHITLAARAQRGNKSAKRALQTFLSSLLSTLDKRELTLLRYLSINTQEISATCLCQMTAAPAEARSHLDRLIQRGIISCRGQMVKFSSEGLGRLVLSRLSPDRRKAMHEAVYRTLLSESDDTRPLAFHAEMAGLAEDAVNHYNRDACDHYGQRNFAQAYASFSAAMKVSAKSSISLNLSYRLQRAWCCIKLGRHREAKTLLVDLAKDAADRADHGTLCEIYQALANFNLKCSPYDRGRLLSLALSFSDASSEEHILLQNQLAQVQLQAGQIDEALAAIEDVESQVEHYKIVRLQGRVLCSRAYLLLNVGRFSESLRAIRSAHIRNPSLKCIALTNAAVCQEQLGRLRIATRLQIQAHTIATKIGLRYVELGSLANLASIASKNGYYTQAAKYFETARDLVRSVAGMDSGFDSDCLVAIDADETIFDCDRGKYKCAFERIDRHVQKSSLTSELEKSAVQLARLNCYSCMNWIQGIQQWVQTVHSNILSLPFFKVEETIALASCDCIDAPSAVASLRTTLETAKGLGTRHQQCRLMTELARVLLAQRDFTASSKIATIGWKIARRNGYRPLMAKALMLRGRASSNGREKQRCLMEALKLAAEIGLPELIAEASYHLGMLHMEEGRFLLAQEHLLKSTSVTAELTENVPRRFRSGYMSVSWRKEALVRLRECAEKVVATSPRGEAAQKASADDRYIKTLYKLTVASKSAQTPDALIPAVLETLEQSVRASAVVLICNDGGTAWHAVRTKLTDEIKQHALAVAEKAGGRPYFGGPQERDPRGSLAWVPFHSHEHSGGLYIHSVRRDHRLTEPDLEFLTVLGSLISDAFDRIKSRPAAAPAAEISEFCGLIGASRAMKEVYRHIEIAAASPATVLIEGESGTGKELVARAIHEKSKRASGHFIPVDCGALPETLIESELFGYRRGAFTGAVADHPGLFEAAHKGTLFLDEISNTTPGLQARLLRVIQEREVRRLGEAKGRAVDVRLIVATNTNLDHLVQLRQFRQDLLFRLKVLHIRVPPLRNRREDIPLLTKAYVGKLNAAHSARKYATPAFLTQLSTLSYPGNVRELHNVIERSYVFAKSAAITSVATDPSPGSPVTGAVDEIQLWFKDLTEGRKDFWSAVRDRYKRRDISREKVVALIDLGLRSTRGSYKTMCTMFQIQEKEYRRFMDFLRRSDCQLDFRPYRKQNPQ